MKRIVFIFLILAGCVHRPALVTEQSQAEVSSLSTIAAAVAQARADNARQPAGSITHAIELLLKIAIAGLPIPTAEDLARMSDLSATVLAGRPAEAEVKADAMARELAGMRAQIERERTESAARLREILADAEARVKAAEADGTRKAFLALIWVTSITGGLISLAGVLIAWMSTYRLIGVAIVLLGPCVPGSAMLWGKPWFFISAGVGILLCGLAVGIKLVWSIIDRGQKRASGEPVGAPAAPSLL